MTTAVRRLVARFDRGLAPRLFVLLAVAGLLAPCAARTAGPDGPAWFPGHGHIFLSSDAATRLHTHPWNPAPARTHDTSAERGDAGGSDVATSDGGVLFTIGDLSAASAMAMLALPAFAPPLVIAWLSHAVGTVPDLARARSLTPPVPPPQG